MEASILPRLDFPGAGPLNEPAAEEGLPRGKWERTWIQIRSQPTPKRVALARDEALPVRLKMDAAAMMPLNVQLVGSGALNMCV
jgi:hypothetical protein